MRYGFPGEPAPPPGVRLTEMNLDVYDPLLGETYAEIGARARSNHKTQGMAQLLALPGAVEHGLPARRKRHRRSDRQERPLALRRRRHDDPGPCALRAGRRAGGTRAGALDNRGAGRVRRANSSPPAARTAAVAPLVAGLKAVRALRDQLGSGTMAIPGRRAVRDRRAAAAQGAAVHRRRADGGRDPPRSALRRWARRGGAAGEADADGGEPRHARRWP